MMETIVIRFDEFEGPMDLLIELIKKRELDIYNLPMSVITKDFIKNIEHMKNKDMEVTSEFTAMASLLLKIKTEMLLPSSKDDPRNILVKEIEEYEKYKSNLDKIKELQFIEQKYFKRTKKDVSKKKKQGSILDVIQSYNLIMRKKKLKERNLKLDELSKKLSESKYSIDEQMEYLMSHPDKNIDVNILFEHISDLEEMVVTFSALLELIKIQFFKVESLDEKVMLVRKL